MKTHTLGIDIAKLNFEVNLRPVDSVQDRRAASFTNNVKGFKALQRWLLEQHITQPEHRQLQDLTRTRQALQQYRESLANLLETATGLARQAIQRQVASLNREVQRLEQAIQELLDQPACAQLKAQVDLADSVPAVGPLTAAVVLAEWPPLQRVATAQRAIALFGLDPKGKTSGTTVKTRPRLSKMGSKRGRRALYMPAMVALRHNPVVRALGQRLKAKGRSGKYIVVAAMRKLLRLIFGVIKSGQPFDAQWSTRSTPSAAPVLA